MELMLMFTLQVLVSPLSVMSFTGESELICSQRPIVALVGDDVILPCHLEPPISAFNETVEWTRSDLEPSYVHFHQDGRRILDHQNSDYYFRTQLFVDEMTRGNVSMKILGVKLSDTGTYRCCLPSMQKDAYIQLTVDPELICSSEPVEAAVGENVTLQCHLVPPLDATNMKVEWRHEGLNHTVDLHQDGQTSLFPDGLSTGNLSLKVSSVRLSDSGRYRCSFSSENLQDSCYVNLTVVRAEQSDDSSHRILIGVLVGIFVPIVIVAKICVIVWRCNRRPTRDGAEGDGAESDGNKCDGAECLDTCMDITACVCELLQQE